MGLGITPHATAKSSSVDDSSMPTLLLVISVTLLITHCVASMVARKHGTRDEVARKRLRESSGYELANQDDEDLNQELLDSDMEEDDDDFQPLPHHGGHATVPTSGASDHPAV